VTERSEVCTHDRGQDSPSSFNNMFIIWQATEIFKIEVTQAHCVAWPTTAHHMVSFVDFLANFDSFVLYI